MELKKINITNDLVSMLKTDWFKVLVFTTLSILAPLFIKSPQLLVGSIVNLCLFLSANKLGFKKSLFVIVLPSLVAYSSNILFKGATPFILYFMPVIYIGNSIYVLLNTHIKNKFISVILSSVSKSLLLYIFAIVFVKEIGLPKMFLTSMGVTQLYTALIGGCIGLIFTIRTRE